MAELKVPVVKSKGQTISIDTDNLPEAVFREAMLLGLKTLLNRGTTKITSTTYPDAEELKAAAMAKAQEQYEAIMAGKVRLSSGSKGDKVSGAVMTEAMRLARALVKAELKKAGIKVSHIEAKEITKAAKDVIANNPEVVEEAKANIAEREKATIKLDVGSIAISPKLVAKAAADAEAKKKPKADAAVAAGATRARARGAQPTAH